jgi:hypothetical protein
VNEILEYIRKCLDLGLSEQDIKAQLKQAGWDENLISQAWTETQRTLMPRVRSSELGPLEILNPSADPAAVPEGEEMPAPPSLWSRVKLFIFIGAAIIILGGGGYLAYAQYANNPDRIWPQTASNARAIKSGHVKIQANYSDPLPPDLTNQTSGLGTTLAGLGDLALSASAEGDFQTSSSPTLDYSLTSTGTIQLGSIKLSIDGESRKIANNVYYKLNNNILGYFLSNANANTAKADWVKLDLASPNLNNPLAKLSQAQIQQILDAFTKVTLVKPGKLLGSEKIDNQDAWHYQASLDKTQLSLYVDEVNKIIGIALESRLDVKSLVDKLDMRKVEVWIGKSDHEIHQIIVESNFPSVYGAIAAAQKSAFPKARDAKRISDVRQMQTALELFFNANGRYPIAIDGLPDPNDGNPTKFSSIMAVIPHAPIPADGNCGTTDNYYSYTQLNNGTSYSIDFCLGQDLSNASLKAGRVETTPEDIRNLGSPVGNSTQTAYSLTDIPFSATLTLKINFSNLNKSVKIEEPQGAVDYNQTSKTNTSSMTSTGQPIFYAPSGQLVSEFPKELILDQNAVISQSYIITENKITQYTTIFTSGLTPAQVLDQYKAYSQKNNWQQTNETDSPELKGLSEQKGTEYLSIVIVPKNQGSEATVTISK